MECLENVPTDLYDARLRRNLPLEELSARTSLSPKMLRLIEEGRFDELPAGPYARSYVRSFAAEVGLDPDATLRRVEHLLPCAPDPLPVWREMRGPSMSDRLVGMLARLWTPKPEEPVDQNEPLPDDEVAATEVRPREPLKLTRWGAAALDATVLLAINAGLVLLIAWGSGLSASALLKQASVSLAGMCAVPTVVYFILFNGIAGKTFGTGLCRLPDPGPHPPLTLDAILRRTVMR